MIINPHKCLHAASIPKHGSYRDILQFEVYPEKGRVKDLDTLFSTIQPYEEILNYSEVRKLEV